LVELVSHYFKLLKLGLYSREFSRGEPICGLVCLTSLCALWCIAKSCESRRVLSREERKLRAEISCWAKAFSRGTSALQVPDN